MKFLFVKTKKIGGVEKSIEPSLHIFRESVLSIPFLGGEDDIFATDLSTKKRKSCGSGRLTNDAVKEDLERELAQGGAGSAITLRAGFENKRQ